MEFNFLWIEFQFALTFSTFKKKKMMANASHLPKIQDLLKKKLVKGLVAASDLPRIQ